jgi:hypothetical protein
MPQLDGPFIQTTNVFDVIDARDLDTSSEDFKQLIIRLSQQVNDIAIQLNKKVHGDYSLIAYANGRTLYPEVPGGNERGTGFVTIDFGALPNAGMKSIAHNIVFNADTRITYLYAVANNPTIPKGLPIPYVDVTTAGASNIELNIDNTNVNITDTIDLSAYRFTTVFVEYTT